MHPWLGKPTDASSASASASASGPVAVAENTVPTAPAGAKGLHKLKSSAKALKKAVQDGDFGLNVSNSQNW